MIPTQLKILGEIPGSSAGAVIAMQLASIAYCEDIPGSLNTYIPEWKAVWIPTKSVKGQFAFIAYNGSQYAVAIRGSILNFSWGSFDNWFEQDFNIFHQVDWKYTTNPNAKPMISKGTSEGLENLNQLVDENGDTLVSFLLKYAVAHGIPLCVTGHSLGAYLSTAFAPYLHYQIIKEELAVPSVFSVFTFAAPTAGNAAFANEYDALFPNSWRFYNQLDLIPFSASNVNRMADLFPPPGIAASDVMVEKTIFKKTLKLSLAMAIKAVDVLLIKSQEHYKSYYSHTNLHKGSITLNKGNLIFDVKSTKSLEAWFEQVGAQHDHNSYLKFLGDRPLDYNFIKLREAD